MPNYKPGPGRRSKGVRKAFMTRLPADVAEVVEAEAAARDLSLSEYLALTTAQALGFEVAVPPRLQPISEQVTIDLAALHKSA